MNNAISRLTDFAYEGHFSKDASWDVLYRFKEAGYMLHLIFFGLDDIEISSDRVLIRAKEGGHHVDPLTLRDNYFGNLRQVNNRYHLFNTLKVIDTSELEHRDLVFIQNGNVIEALGPAKQPGWFTENMPNIAKLIK